LIDNKDPLMYHSTVDSLRYEKLMKSTDKQKKRVARVLRDQKIRYRPLKKLGSILSFLSDFFVFTYRRAY